jgi:hypothetical protein
MVENCAKGSILIWPIGALLLLLMGVMESIILSQQTPWFLRCLGNQHPSEYVETHVGISILL